MGKEIISFYLLFEKNSFLTLEIAAFFCPFIYSHNVNINFFVVVDHYMLGLQALMGI